MHYRMLGKTGRKVSILGFGCLRLPTIGPENPKINPEEAIKVIRKGIDGGINFVDTAYSYHSGESEIVLGKALKDGYREKVTLMTKAPIWAIRTSEDFDQKLEEQLKKLDVDCIDVYLFHNLGMKRFKEKVSAFNLIERASVAKEQGKIKHLGFSSHDKPKNIRKFIDMDAFEVVLVQYNLIDPSNEEVIQYAAEKGLGVAIMGPVGGGRLTMASTKEMEKLLSKGKDNFVDLALKYVWSNPNISVVLSGMGSEEMVDENLALLQVKNIC